MTKPENQDRKLEKVSVRYERDKGGEITIVDGGNEQTFRIPPGKKAVFRHELATNDSYYQLTFYLDV